MTLTFAHEIAIAIEIYTRIGFIPFRAEIPHPLARDHAVAGSVEDAAHIRRLAEGCDFGKFRSV